GDDPLTHLDVSVDAQRSAAATMHDLAHEVCGGRWLALGGGGYSLAVVARAWTHLVAIAAHAPIELTTPIPGRWAEHAEGLVLTNPVTLGDVRASRLERPW